MAEATPNVVEKQLPAKCHVIDWITIAAERFSRVPGQNQSAVQASSNIQAV